MTPLHRTGDLLREAFAAIPLNAARLLFVALPFLILVWLLALPNEQTTAPGSRSATHNLKWWAALALLIQIAIYVLA
ncbi:MAG: hypothetical protein KatS3mg109_0966 [Pirellulaceae bacterium]|nr:MAG: hypothetical protein KatS3mg109_0876 [Pirellulaceae bacterium]GIW90534.1 MAG: hypothetical protein KatS3mg109_0966 [Pirellulaceae bacterium]GIW94499.1 MAG: hypothetical protein KatS3mg110_2540 [Pirellulaceae bacterium]